MRPDDFKTAIHATTSPASPSDSRPGDKDLIVDELQHAVSVVVPDDGDEEETEDPCNNNAQGETCSIYCVYVLHPPLGFPDNSRVLTASCSYLEGLDWITLGRVSRLHGQLHTASPC